jgi:hypothetical protein
MPKIYPARDVRPSLHQHFPPIRWGVINYALQPMGESYLNPDTPPLRHSEGGFFYALIARYTFCRLLS